MFLLEHQAKTLLRNHGLPVPDGSLITTRSQHSDVPFPLMLKAQIPKGGRGKAGGVRRADNDREFDAIIDEMLGSRLLDCPVDSLLAEAALTPGQELYLSLVIDPLRRCPALLARRRGGVEVEAAAASATDADDGAAYIALTTETDAAVIDRLMVCYGVAGQQLTDDLTNLVRGLYRAGRQQDAVLIEINPLMVVDGRLICADAKIELDDAAAFRHPDRDDGQAGHPDQFVVVDPQGTVGSMANGAGLAMATIDAIQAAGVRPANFLDVGGGTDAQGMVTAFGRLADMTQVSAIVVNIFGGITRCDQVAEAIIAARAQLPSLPPLFIRLEGTRQTEGRQLLQEQGISTLDSLADCVAAASAVVRNTATNIDNGQPEQGRAA